MKYDSVRLGEIIINHDSKRVPLSSMQRKRRQGIYRYFGAQGVIDYVDDYIFDGRYLLVAEDGENLKSNKQRICQIVNGKFWVNNHAHIIQTKDNCDMVFLYYYLCNTDISGYITGSAQPKLSQSNLNALEIKLPEMSIQTKIAKILEDIDRKIGINEEINKNLAA